MVTSRIEEGGGFKVNAASAAMNQRQKGGSGERYEIPVGIVEELVLQRLLPPPAAEAIADALAWCDRRRIAQIITTTTSKSGSNAGSKKDGSRGRLVESLQVRGLKRVGAVWAEPSFLNQSPLTPGSRSSTRDFCLQLYTGGLLRALLLTPRLLGLGNKESPLSGRARGLLRLDYCLLIRTIYAH